MEERYGDARATSWPDLIDKLYAGSWQSEIFRHRSTWAFRGVFDAASSLETSLMRLGGNYGQIEVSLIRNFTKYAQVSDSFRYTLWDWLALAQHHGVPTRLLDWTYSPFVAAHFATSHPEHYDVDGVIWCLDFVEVHRLLPESLRGELDRDNSDVFTVPMLAQVAPTLQQFAGISSEPFLLFFEPPSIDSRVVNQFALHSVVSRADVTISEVLSQHPQLCRRIVIPRELKWEIRDKLDQANINERVLFPGLDGLARWLSRYYSPRSGRNAVDGDPLV